MRIYEIAAPDGKTYEIEGPEGATKAQLVQVLLAKNPYAGQTTQELQEAPSAPSKLKDVGIAALTGLAGGAQSLTDLFGAGNIASKGLSSIQQSAQEGLSEARKAEIARDEELKKRAEGSFLGEAGAGFRSFANAPFQEGIQALFSSAPIIAAGALTGGAGAVPLTAARAGLAARAAQVGRVAASGTGVGAAMGLGGQKGQDYETVKRELMNRGMPEPEAEAKAQEAAAYSLQNLPRQALAAGAGALEGRYGVEGVLSDFMKKRAATAAAGKAFTPELPPGYGKAAVSSILGEMVPEGIQAATGQVGTNIALTQAGIPTDALQGVTSAVAHDAAVAALLGTAVTPFQKINMVREFNQTMVERQQKAIEEDAKRREEFERKRQEEIAKTRQQLGIEEKPMLALPAPAEKLEAAPPVTDPLMNPLGNLTKDELGRAVGIPDVYKYVDKYRRDNNLPKLETYSIEDLKDAQPGLAESGEAGALNSIIAFKSGFTADAKVTADDVLGMAQARNVETGTKGFDDFLTRTTGVDSLDQMEPPQLFAVHQALAKLPEPAEGGAPIILPQGTNAKLFKQNQYDQAISAVDTALSGQGLSLTPGPMTEAATLDVIKQATGLTLDKHAKALMDTAVQQGDLDLEMTPKYEVTDPATGVRVGDLYETRKEAQAAAKPKGLNVNEVTESAIVAPKTATVLPDEFDIQEGEFKTGEAPDGFDIVAGDKVLRTESTYEAAAAKIEGFAKNRQRLADRASKDIVQAQEDIQASEDNLNKMASLGQANTLPYQIAEGKHANLIKEKKAEIEKLNKQLDFFNPEKTPISIKPRKLTPVRRRGHTVLQKGIPSATFPTRTAAEEHIIANMSDQQLKKLTKTEGRRTLAKRALAELQAREDKKAGITKGIEVKRSDIEREPEVSQEVKDKIAELEKFLLPALRKLGLNDVALKIEQSIAGGAAGGSYYKSLIKIAMDEENPLLTMRHEALHALKDLGFFTPQQWATLERKARTEWVNKYLLQRNADGKPINPNEASRYDAYERINIIEPTVWNRENPDKPQRTVMSQADFMDLIIEEAIADAFADFTVNKPPAGMIAALMQRLNKFFEALRNAMAGAGFQTVDDIFGKVEAGELKALGQGAGAEKASVRNVAKGLLNPNISAKNEKVLNDVIEEMGLTPEEFASTSLVHQTGKPGTEQFETDNIGGLRDVVTFLQDERRKSGLPLLDTENPADRKIIAKLMATEAMAAIRSGGANLEWYDAVINKTLAMAGLKYSELNTDINARTAFKIATAITSQGLNVEDNLAFAMKVYDQFRANGRFPEIGQGADQSAMISNFKMANYLLDDMDTDFLRQFLETEFTVEEMRSAGLPIGGELGDEKVLGSSVFGPKIGFGFYSNLNGNFEPVTMDMWFMRTIGRLTGNLKAFRQDLYNAQLNKFREEFATEGGNGVFANQFDQAELDLAAADNDAAIALARKVKKTHERDFKINREAYDDKTRVKSKLVAAAETMIGSLDSPKDAPSSGSERRNLRDIVRQMVDIVAEKYGKRVPPASLQAVIWYPEQELYKAMGVKLRVTSQNYAGAIEKILLGEGYGQADLSAAAKLGSRTAQQLAKTAVAKGSQATGAKPVRLGALQAEEKETFLERGRKRVVLEQERIQPKRKRVIFEVAPDPNNKKLTDRWRKVPVEDRIAISNRIGNQIAKAALSAFGLTGYVDTQIGSYMDDTNPSFALYVDSGDAVAMSKFLGFALSQDSMMVVSPKEAKGLDATGAVRIEMGDATPTEINEVYQSLREIRVNDEQPVGGQSFMNGHMTVLNYSNVETQELAKLIDEKLGGDYNVITETVYTSFPEKKDYDYANPTSDPRGNAGVLRQQSRNLRNQATQLLQKELRGKYSLRSTEPGLRPSAGGGVVLGKLQPGAVSFKGAHYGNAKVDTLNGDKYGTGIRGAERRRLDETGDDRIRRRVYFYIPKEDGTMPTPEAGLGQYVYTQQFDNILPPGAEMSKLYSQANANSNQFESAVVDAGYDGYAIPNMGMMVILNHNAPVEYRGTRVEMAERGEKLSVRPPPLIGRVAPNTPEFKRFFDGSKVINDDGSPRLMFHGTVETPGEEGNLFSAFNLSDDGKLGSGVYTTSVPVYAETFGFSQPALMPLYLAAKNPYNINLGDFPTRMKGGNLVLTDEAFNALETQMKEAATKLSGKRLMDLEGSEVRKMFEKAGYDSILAKDSFGNIIEALAFKPEQVKSATGNVGTYDPTNPDIRLSVRNIIGDQKVIDFYMTKTFAREEKGHAARMLDAITPPTYTSLRQMFLNQYDSLARLDTRYAKAKGIVRLMADSSAEAAALMSDMAAGVAARVIGMGGSAGGAPVYRNGATYIDNKNGTIKGPAEIFAPLAKYNDPDIYRAYQVWAGVQRGSRYMQNPNGTYEEKLFNGKDDIAYADFLLTKFPEFKQVQAEWNVYNDGLVDYMVSTGVISKEGGEKFKKHGDYIPFYRQLEGEETIGPKVFQNISGVKPPKKAKGSEAPLADFLETVVRNTQAAIQSGMKNAAALRTVDMLGELGETTKINKPQGINTVSLLRDGKIEHYHVNDPLLVDSLKSLNLAKLPGLGLLSGPANLLRSLVTKDPGFMLANLMRDSMSAWVTSGQNFKPGIDTIRYFGKSLAGNSPEVEALLNFGMGGYEFSKNVEQSGRDLAATLKKKTQGPRTFGQKVLNVGPSIWEALEKGTTASDMATRAAIYKKVMEETGNETEALMRALEVMNFNRRGNSVVVRIATAAIPFFNARMQGLDVLYRAGIRPYIQGKDASDYEKQIAKTFAIRGLTMMAVSALYWAMTHDDDEYLAQEQETRDNNWLLPSLGMRVPIPFEVGVLFKVIPERLLELSLGNDTGKDFSEAMVRNIKSSLFMDLMPQTIKPIYEVTTNYNFYTRRPIVGQGAEGLASEYEVGPGTSSFAEGLGKTLGVSPLKLDHLIKAYTGTIGMYGVDLIDGIIDANSDVPKATKRFEQMPFIKRFALDPEARGKVTAYYDLKNSVDEVVRTINHLEKAGNYEEMGEYMKDNMRILAAKDYISALDKEMKSFREMSNMIRSSRMSGDEKRDALLAVTQAQNKLTGNIQEIKKMIASGD
jgi:Large polyvalent protein associated domain 38/ADP-Ribosyltransferase in polyvalent proteins